MSLSADKTGIWIVRTQKHLQDFVGTPHLNYYDSTIIAGLCGRLMSKLRKMEVVDFKKLVILSADIGTMKSHLKEIIIPTLQQNSILNIHKDNTGPITKVEEDVPATEEILPLVTEIWHSRQPENVEIATIESQEICSESPCHEATLKTTLLSRGYKENEIDLSLDLQSSYQILGNIEEPKGGKLLYSEYVWGNIMKSSGGNWLAKLSTEQHREVQSAVMGVNYNQGMPLDTIKYSETIAAAVKAGLLRICPVKTLIEEKKFAFTPSIGHIYSDESDEVKTFLACLRFGQHYSSTSRILNPLWIVNAMLERDSHTIGPATDIGTDYILLEKAGIVRVEEDSNYPGRSTMTLIKDDVAKKVKEILHQGTLSGLEEEEPFEPIMSPNSLVSPEQHRIRMGKLPPLAKEAEEKIFKVFRSEDY